jgi:hypothetical protein
MSSPGSSLYLLPANLAHPQTRNPRRLHCVSKETPYQTTGLKGWTHSDCPGVNRWLKPTR